MKKKKIGSNRSTAKVGYPGVKIILLQVLPGHESNVEKSFREKLTEMKEQSEIKGFWTFKLFGDWDIAIIYECAEFKQDTLYAGTIPKIINSTEFFSFPWEVYDSEENHHSTFRKDLLDCATLGITFFKVHPDALRPKSSPLNFADVDQAFVKLVSEDQFSCLCSLGWAEYIILTHGSTIEELIGNINNKLGNVLVRHDNDLSGYINLAVKTFSMVGINYAVLEDKKTLNKHFKNIKLDKTIKVSVSVTCDLPSMEDVRKNIIESFFDGKKASRGKVYSVIGNKDISFDIDTRIITSWADFIYYLLKFRIDQKEKLFSTSVDIKSSAFNIHPYKSVFLSDPPIIILDEKQIKTIREKLGHLAEPIVQSIYYFNELLQNRINADSYYDMSGYLLSLLQLAIETDNRNFNFPEDIPKKFNVVKYGIAQRSAGVFFNQEYQRGLPVLPKGGVQRIIQAVESIPQYVYKTIYHEDWYGFIISGYSIRYSHESGGAINIQAGAIFNPEKWWGIFHELGHTWTDSEAPNPRQSCIFEDRSFRDNINFKMGIDKEDDRNINQVIKEIAELFADIFNYYFFNGKDFWQYVKVLWKYLLSEMKSDQAMKEAMSFYLFRTFYVFIYSALYVEKNLTFATLDFIRIKNLYSVFIKQLKEITDDDQRNEVTEQINKRALQDKVINYFADYKWTLTYARKYVEQTKVDFYSKTEAENINENLIPKLKKGEILGAEEIRNPALMILLLKRFTLSDASIQLAPEEKFKIRMATILSLWYYYQNIKPRTLPDRVVDETGNR